MEINERIFHLLNQQGKKASALADFLGIKPSSITGWKNEGSYPSSKYIQKISEFLNVPIEYLVNGSTVDNFVENENNPVSEERGIIIMQNMLKGTSLVDENNNLTENSAKIIGDFLKANEELLQLKIEKNKEKK